MFEPWSNPALTYCSLPSAGIIDPATAALPDSDRAVDANEDRHSRHEPERQPSFEFRFFGIG
jgi:hypothetical protein